MKIGFINLTPLKYTVETPYKEPLGGSESAMCYLSEELARGGHEVTLFVDYKKAFTLRGVKHYPQGKVGKKILSDLDVLVIQNTVDYGAKVKTLLGTKTKLVFWSEHAHDQMAVKKLGESKTRDVYDGFVFISHWQLEKFVESFGIDRRKCWILRNAVSPVFEKLFKPGGDVLAKKATPPIIAYASTPFRGLELLIQFFPEIRKEIPGTTLRVYSSMKVYQANKEDTEYEKLYQKCRETEGIEYHGSVSQEELAKGLSEAIALTYPNTFPETSSIAVMEAMAAGCQIITTNAAALPETAAGFGSFVNPTENWSNYGQTFILAVTSFLRQYLYEKENVRERLTRQVAFTRYCYSWKVRAKEWESWLKELVETKA